MIDVVLASCHPLPEPDPDEAPLLAALRARGLSAATWVWDDDTVDWAGARLVVLRSTWDYFRDRDRFLRWATDIAAVTALHNPVAVVAWNTHKRYLLDLSARGVSVVPTELVERGSGIELSAVCANRGWGDIVVKPAVAAASFGAYATNAGELDDRRFAALVRKQDMLVQPFVESVRTHGERSIVVIDGHLTHSVRKEPRFGDDAENVSGPHPIAPEDRALARAALAAIPADTTLLYARVDIVRDENDMPMVAELELAEPSLFFPFSQEALTRMVAGLERHLC